MQSIRAFRVVRWKNCSVDQSLIRRALATDIPELLRLRGVMFRDMGFDIANTDWIDFTSRILERQVSNATLIGAVLDRVLEPGLCASGLLQIQEGLGSPHFPKGLVGHISSVVVDPGWRKQGIGENVIRFLIDEARTLGLERVELHAAPDGEGVYRRIGFRDRQGGIELRLEL